MWTCLKIGPLLRPALVYPPLFVEIPIPRPKGSMRLVLGARSAKRFLGEYTPTLLGATFASTRIARVSSQFRTLQQVEVSREWINGLVFNETDHQAGLDYGRLSQARRDLSKVSHQTNLVSNSGPLNPAPLLLPGYHGN